MTSHTGSWAAPGRVPVPRGLVGAPVVAGFDESNASVAAVQWAAAQAARLGSELSILSASEPPIQAPVGAGVIRHPPDLRTVSRATAGRGVDLARSFDPDGVIGAVGVVGGPAGELVARSSGTGLLVVGRNRRSALQAAVLGSVALAVAMHARCPVAVVGEGPQRHPGASRPVVVGIDGSRPSLGAVSLAVEFARVWHAPLRVVMAWHTPLVAVWPLPPADGAVATSSRRPWVLAAQAAIDEAIAHVRAVDPDLPVSGAVVEGRAEDVLVEESQRAGLLVIGSRGHGGFAGLMMGSVSHGVMRRANSPVVVVRRGSV